MCSSRIVWFRLQLLLTSCKRKLFFKLQEYKKYISRADTSPNIIVITGLTPFKLKLRLTWDWGFRGLDRPWEKPSATFISFITAHDTNNFLKHFFYNSNTLKKLFLPSEIHASISITVSFIANIASGAKKFNDEDSDPEGVLFYE